MKKFIRKNKEVIREFIREDKEEMHRMKKWKRRYRQNFRNQ